MATTTSTDLTDSEALRLAIHALACMTAGYDDMVKTDDGLEPLYQEFKDKGMEAIGRLVRLREQKRRIEQLTEQVMSDEPVPCICGQCIAADTNS